ncbi:MAG: hypothetical protein L6Q57_07625 [Alphaproteobacteria bacterium]|nr:hypothetical protein [Alphaproteobacteria bacterium]
MKVLQRLRALFNVLKHPATQHWMLAKASAKGHVCARAARQNYAVKNISIAVIGPDGKIDRKRTEVLDSAIQSDLAAYAFSFSKDEEGVFTYSAEANSAYGLEPLAYHQLINYVLSHKRNFNRLAQHPSYSAGSSFPGTAHAGYAFQP